MKQTIFFLISLVVAFFQGFASPVDSLKMNQTTFGHSTEIDIPESTNGWGRADNFDFDGDLLVSDLVTNGTTATNSSNSKVIKVYKNLTRPKTEIDYLYYSRQKVNEEKSITILVVTDNITKDLQVSVTGTNKDMFKVDPPVLKWQTTEIYGGAIVKVTYCPKIAGDHSALLVIKEKGLFGKKKTINLYGSANSIITIGNVNNSTINFTKGGTKTFTVKCPGAGGKLYLNLTGTGKRHFSVSPTTISQANAGNENTITVKCTPPMSSVYYAEAQIEIYCDCIGDKEKKIVYLKLDNGYGNMANGYTLPEDESQEEFTEEHVATTSSADDHPSIDEEEMVKDIKISADNYSTVNLDEIAADVKIYAEGQVIVIESAVEQNAVICDVAGRGRTVSLMVGRNEIPVNAGGLYIVRVRDKAAKLLLK